MNLKSISKGLLAAACVAIPAFAGATPYTVTIAGVDLNNLPTPGTILTPAAGSGIFFGLGDCGTGPASAPNACDNNPPIGINPLATPADVAANNGSTGTSSNAVIFGYGLALDQVIFHQLITQIDVTGGVVSLGVGLNAQEFDFLVGPTGGGSAGPGPNTSITYDLDLARFVTICTTDPTPICETHLVSQPAQLSVGWDLDTLTINGGPAVNFTGLPDQIGFQFLAAAQPFTEGDPPVFFGLLSGANSVPAPPTMALLLFGMGILRFSKRRAVAVA